MTPEQARVLDAVNASPKGTPWHVIAGLAGASSGEAARSLYRRATQHENIDPAIRDSMRAANTGVIPSVAWVKTKAEDGTAYSVMLRPEPVAAEDIAGRIRDVLADIAPLPEVAAPEGTADDLCGLLTLFDLHAGMMAWHGETGQDYDTREACRRVRDWTARAIAAMPSCGMCVLLFNGDTLHTNDLTNATPKSKHVLDVDTRLMRTLELTIAAIDAATQAALEKHGRVLIVGKAGNHDPTSYLALVFALHGRFLGNPRVTVDMHPSEFWAYHFGTVMLCAHHGHKSKPVDMVLAMAHQWPQIWGETRWRYLWTGHLHHLKQSDIGGVQWEQARAVASRDAHSASHGYAERPEIQAVIYHRDRGEVQRHRVADWAQ